MAEADAGEGLQIDSDWKVEAAREKERLVAEERKQRDSGKGGGEPGANILELVNLVAMQAAIGLGGFDGPGGERIAPNLGAAKFHIDLLEVLQNKTEGNLTDEEKKVIDAVLYELRMQYVQVAPGSPAAAASKTDEG